MRPLSVTVTPVGIAMRPGEALVDRVVEASRVTHNTGLAIAGAAAVAAAVSAAIDGEPVLASAIAAAESGARRGVWIAGADVAARIAWATELADPADPLGSIDAIAQLIGTSLATQESVPAAFGVSRFRVSRSRAL